MARDILWMVAAGLMLVAWGAVAVVVGGEGEAPELSREQRVRQYVSLARELAGLFAEKDYEAAVGVCRRMAALAPKRTDPPYNLACAHARLGQPDEAFAALEGAVERGWADAAHMEQDPDLAALRDDPRWKTLLAKTRANRAAAPYDEGEAITGVRTLDRMPEEGLRYRLRMSPEATAGRPARLVLWMHPAGGSMNRTVEAMSPQVIEAGYALLVPTQKSFIGWTGADAAQLLKGSLKDAARVEGIDTGRPVLLGYSAGGQMALELYYDDPGAFAGLVLDAAYPVRLGGRPTLVPPPKDEAIKAVPVYALVGTRDGGARIWNEAETVWREAGVPLTVEYVEGKPHTWLFGKAQRERLVAWLKAVAAGETPSGTVGTSPAKAANDS